MNRDELRQLVQKTLREERGVTDVAFNPLDGGLEQVLFYENGLRASFVVNAADGALSPDLFRKQLDTLAAFGVNMAQDIAARQRAAKAAENA